MPKRDGSRDLTDQQAKLLRDALKPYTAKCSGKQKGLAALMGVDQSGFNRFMAGKQGTSWGVAFRAAGMMGLTVNDLFGATPTDLKFSGIDSETAREAARLALLDGIPRTQIEARYQGASARGLKEFRLDDWHALLSGSLNPDKLPKAQPDPSKPRQKKS